MSATGLITRAELSLADLVIDGSIYGFRPNPEIAKRTRRRTTAAPSPFVWGTTETSSVPDQSVNTIVMTAKATSESALIGYVSALTDAVEQSTYEMAMTINGVTYRWTCDPADWAVAFDESHLFTRKANITLIMPRSPRAVTGPF